MTDSQGGEALKAESDNALRLEAWELAFHAYGTAFIFRERFRRYRRKLRILAFVGLIVPLAVGGFVLAFGTGSAVLPYLTWLAASLGLAQLSVSAWSIVARWDDSLASASDGMVLNQQLYAQFKRLGREGPCDIAHKMDILRAQYQAKETEDERQAITEPERRKGMRAALRQLRKACATCSIVPDSMKPSKCATCGNF